MSALNDVLQLLYKTVGHLKIIACDTMSKMLENELPDGGWLASDGGSGDDDDNNDHAGCYDEVCLH